MHDQFSLLYFRAATIHYLMVHWQCLLRSNKRDASKIISKRLTRVAKLAVHLAPPMVDEDEAAYADDAEVDVPVVGVDDVAAGVGAAAAGVGEVVAAAVADEHIMVTRRKRALVMELDALRTSVLPDGAQYRGVK